jgi:hypothetical protein
MITHIVTRKMLSDVLSLTAITPRIGKIAIIVSPTIRTTRRG